MWEMLLADVLVDLATDYLRVLLIGISDIFRLNFNFNSKKHPMSVTIV